ncbi:hypothetical protein GYB57_04550 [bacterium]|nr:hypothetical protein [bacterium]
MNDLKTIERDFLNKIDCKFPYHNRKECLSLIDESFRVSANSTFAIVEEICRSPSSIKNQISNRIQFELIELVDSKFKHPLKELVLETARLKIQGKEISVKQATSNMQIVSQYHNQYAALNIMYFSCDDSEEQLESVWDEVINKWKNEIKTKL